MEVVLQWLDEFEDLVFVLAALWESLRGALLQIGLLAALALQASQWWPITATQVSLLAGVALLSVTVWSIGSFWLFWADPAYWRSAEPT